ncbi:MAG: TonB-dependent receptor [Emcibacter sp.]|nr:TonB-dependent receptor [Emcibacter sp.]
MINTKRSYRLTLLTNCLLMSTSISAMAQTETDKGIMIIEDIVVTAQKSSENLQTVPIAITAMSGDKMARRQINGIEGLSSISPNVDFGTYGGVARLAVRGIGFDTINPGAEGRIAYHLDGVYIGRPSATLGTFFDIERVEVLRGPQGTLYGRNATGGSVNVIARQPTEELEGYIRAGYGNYNAVTFEGAVGGSLNDIIGFRIAGKTLDRDGYGKNIITGNDIDDAKQRAFRAIVTFDLEDFQIKLSADYSHENDNNYGNHYFGPGNAFITPLGIELGGLVADSPRDIANESDPKNDREFWGISSEIEFMVSDITVKSITSYRDSMYRVDTELDQTSYPISTFIFDEEAEQFSQELQISGQLANTRFILGAYYFDEKITGGTHIPLSLRALGAPSDVILDGYHVSGNTHTQALAGFGQINIDLSDRTVLTLGGRYSWEKKDIDDYFQFDLVRAYIPGQAPLPVFTRQDSSSNTAFTPKIGMEFILTPDVMLYASISKGFKSGGFNLGDLEPAFQPEQIWSYETGLKGTWVDGRLRVNGSAFYYDYTNIQVSKVVGTSVIIENAASSEIYGIEAEITAIPVNNLQIDIAASWLQTKFKDFTTADPARPELITPANPLGEVNLSGNQLTQAPKFSVNAGIEYTWDIEDASLTLRGELKYQDRIYFTPFNIDAVSREPNTKFNAFLTYSNDIWTMSLYGRNLSNSTTVANSLVNSGLVGFPVSGSIDAPRTYGIQISRHF